MSLDPTSTSLGEFCCINTASEPPPSFSQPFNSKLIYRDDFVGEDHIIIGYLLFTYIRYTTKIWLIVRRIETHPQPTLEHHPLGILVGGRPPLVLTWIPRGLNPLLRNCCLCEMKPASNESIGRVQDFSRIPLTSLPLLARQGAMVEPPGVETFPPSVYFRTRALSTRILALIMEIYLDGYTFYTALDDYDTRHGHPQNLTGDPDGEIY